MRLEFGKDHFDWIEIRAVGGKIKQTGIATLNGLANPGHLVGRKIIADDDVTGLQFRGKHLLDISQEHGAFHGAIEQQWSREAVVTQGSDECRSAPMAMRHAGMTALSARGTSVKARHFCVEPCFIQEDQPTNIPEGLLAAPLLASCLDIRPVLLRGAQRFFYSSSSDDQAGATER
jgi:hypothetical protein